MFTLSVPTATIRYCPLAGWLLQVNGKLPAEVLEVPIEVHGVLLVQAPEYPVQ